MTRTPTRAWWPVVAVLCWFAVACGGDAEVGSAPVLGSDSADSQTEAGGQGAVTTLDPSNATTTTSAPLDGPGVEVPPEFTPRAGAHRVAPAASRPSGPMWYWQRESAGGYGHTTSWTTVTDGPVHELAEAYPLGLVVQRDDEPRVLWLTGPDGDRDLIVAGENQSVALEGAATDGERPIIYYQRYERGSVEDTRSTLRAFDPTTGEVTELLQTGGWESGTSFNHLSGGLAVGRWSGEAYSALVVVDLDSGRVVHDTRDDACFDGEEDCIVYDAATAVGQQIYGVRPVWNDARGVVDAVGVFRYDPDSRTDELVVSYPWDNGLWYVEDLFAQNGQLVLSLSDGDDQPLPALTVDLTGGEDTTSPLAGFVRPAYLS